MFAGRILVTAKNHSGEYRETYSFESYTWSGGQCHRWVGRETIGVLAAGGVAVLQGAGGLDPG
jgi:hypothetical protein